MDDPICFTGYRSSGSGAPPRGGDAVLPPRWDGAGRVGRARGPAGRQVGVQQSSHGRRRRRPRGRAGPGHRPGAAAAPARAGLPPARGPRRRARRRVRVPPGRGRGRLADGGPDHLRADRATTSSSTGRWPAGACARPRTPSPVCVTVTLVDGLVLARSVFNHSVNYRCAMVYGLPELVDDPRRQAGARLEALSEHVVPGPVGLRPAALGQGAGRHHRAAPRPSTRRRSR